MEDMKKMDAQELIKLINQIDYDGAQHLKAKDDFIKRFPLDSIQYISKERYCQVAKDPKNVDKNTFCYNLEYVDVLPFGIKGGNDSKFGNPLSDLYPYTQNIYNMIIDAKQGNFTNLRSKHNLNQVWPSVLIKILSIYVPEKFITVGQEFILTILAKILGVENLNNDLIELNHLCKNKLEELHPQFKDYEYNRLGNAIWTIFSQTHRNGFEKWLEKQSKEGKDISGSYKSYPKRIEDLSLFYNRSFFSSNVDIATLNKLHAVVLKYQQENAPGNDKSNTYYSTNTSYGEKYHFSGAVSKFIEYRNSLKVLPKNRILYGPPGTGKTYNTRKYALSIIEGIDIDTISETYTDKKGKSLKVTDAFKKFVKDGRVVFTTFHQSLSYEDFVEGIKPEVNKKTCNVIYEVKSGIFKEICDKARKSKGNYVLVIDEINRGNVAGIFGELITLIEADKREGCDNVISCKLPYSKETFTVPANLYIIGTMNTADRSVEALDSALRRRFDFVEMLPKPDLVEFRKDVFELINKRLRILKDSEHQLGHSYFMSAKDDEILCEVFQYRVIPMIQEYFYGDMEKIRLVVGDGFCVSEEVEANLFPHIDADIDIPPTTWRLWGDKEWKECKTDPNKFSEALNVLINGKKN